jgi:CRP-like cAMP-binding protein
LSICRTRRAGGLGRREAIITYGSGNFIGELAQLSSRPSLVNAEATEPVEVIVIPSQRLRDLMVQGQASAAPPANYSNICAISVAFLSVGLR